MTNQDLIAARLADIQCVEVEIAEAERILAGFRRELAEYRADLQEYLLAEKLAHRKGRIASVHNGMS